MVFFVSVIIFNIQHWISPLELQIPTKIEPCSQFNQELPSAYSKIRFQ